MSFEPLIAECRRPAIRASVVIEWLAIRIVTALIMGMFVTVGMALAG